MSLPSRAAINHLIASLRRALKPECGYCRDKPKPDHYCADCGRMGAEVRE